MGEVKITYETLYDLARREKSSEDLQRLDPAFYADAMNYVREKRALAGQTGPFSHPGDTQNQLANVLKVLREIYERREKKIIRLAIERVRTGSTIIDTTTLLPEEKLYYHDAVKFIAEHRQITLDPLLGSNTQIPSPAPGNSSGTHEQTIETTHESAETHAEDETGTKVRFTTQVPKFLDAERNHHGPFNPGDEAAVPDYIAKILLIKGKAELA